MPTLTLRDQFAMAALAGIAARPFATNKETVAREAYEFADAWLAERAKSPAQQQRERAERRAKDKAAGWSS